MTPCCRWRLKQLRRASWKRFWITPAILPRRARASFSKTTSHSAVVRDEGEGLEAGSAGPGLREIHDGESPHQPPRGTGLGLAIAQSVVSRAQGTISLTSMPGQGTTVKVNFKRIAMFPDTPSPGIVRWCALVVALVTGFLCPGRCHSCRQSWEASGVAYYRPNARLPATGRVERKTDPQRNFARRSCSIGTTCCIRERSRRLHFGFIGV